MADASTPPKQVTAVVATPTAAAAAAKPTPNARRVKTAKTAKTKATAANKKNPKAAATKSKAKAAKPKATAAKAARKKGAQSTSHPASKQDCESIFHAVRFALELADARGWKCPIRRYTQSVDKMHAFLMACGTHAQQNGVFPDLTLHGCTRSGKPCCIIFGANTGTPFNKHAALRACENILWPGTAAVVLVLPKRANRLAVATMVATGARVWSFTHAECFSQFMHNDVSQAHHRLTSAERERLMQHVPLPDQLPKILQSDIVARYLGLRRGSIVGVRQSTDFGVVDNFRVVVAGETRT